MKRRNNSASRIGSVGDQLARVLLFIAAAALAGCQTVGTSPTSEVEENQYAASPANVASLTSVVQRNPNDPQAYNMRGSVLGQAGRNDEALADFNKAISLDPNFGQAYANRGLIQRKTGKLDQALADYGKALELDPSAAFMQGRVKVVGDMGKVMALMPLTHSDEYRDAQVELAAQTEF